MAEQDRGVGGRTTSFEMRRSRIIPFGLVLLLALLALLGVRSRGVASQQEDGVAQDGSYGSEAVPVPTTESPDREEEALVEDPLVGSWASAGTPLEIVLAVGKGADGYDLVDLRDGKVLASGLPMRPELIYPDHVVGTTGLGGASTVSDSLQSASGEVPLGAGLFHHPDSGGSLWTFRQSGSSRREFFVMEERSLADPDEVISVVETPIGARPLISSDGPRFVTTVEGGVYELVGDSDVRRVADGLAVGAVRDRVVTWACNESLTCAVTVSEGPGWETRRLEWSSGLAGHDGEWSISSDGEWVILRDVIAPASHLVGIDSGLIVSIETLSPVVVGADYAFWIRDNQVQFRGLLDGSAGSFEVSGRSKISGLALGPVEILDGFGAPG